MYKVYIVHTGSCVTHVYTIYAIQWSTMQWYTIHHLKSFANLRGGKLRIIKMVQIAIYDAEGIARANIL